MYTKLYEVRRNLNVTQGELAELSKVSQSQISKIEKGSVKTPSHDKLVRIAEALGISIHDFMDEQVERIKTPFKAFNAVGNAVFIPLHTEKQMMNQNFPHGDGFVVRVQQGAPTQIKKPSFLEYSEEAYAATNYGQVMQPRYKQGDTLFVDPTLDVIVGDDVVLLFDYKDKLIGIFREVAEIADDYIMVKTPAMNNPIKFQRSDLHAVHVVVGSQRNRS